MENGVIIFIIILVSLGLLFGTVSSSFINVIPSGYDNIYFFEYDSPKTVGRSILNIFYKFVDTVDTKIFTNIVDYLGFNISRNYSVVSYLEKEARTNALSYLLNFRDSHKALFIVTRSFFYWDLKKQINDNGIVLLDLGTLLYQLTKYDVFSQTQYVGVDISEVNQDNFYLMGFKDVPRNVYMYYVLQLSSYLRSGAVDHHYYNYNDFIEYTYTYTLSNDVWIENVVTESFTPVRGVEYYN